MSPMVKERKFDDRLANYVEVKDRIRQFYERFPDGRLVTANVQVSTEPDGKPRVWVEGAAYRTVDDPLPARGYSWMELPGSTPYTKGSELENTETSAWGRAIGALGIGIEKSIASAQEVRNKEAGEPEPAADAFDAGLVGTAKASGKDDFEMRQSPDGPVLPFRLANGRTSWKVLARGVLAEMIADYRAGIEEKLVTCWGAFEDKSFAKKQPDGSTKTITYQVLNLARLKAGALDLTEPEPDEDDGPTPDEEAEMATLFDAAPVGAST
jgi:hypothetical protein